jgi:hypothetical protein
VIVTVVTISGLALASGVPSDVTSTGPVLSAGDATGLGDPSTLYAPGALGGATGPPPADPATSGGVPTGGAAPTGGEPATGLDGAAATGVGLPSAANVAASDGVPFGRPLAEEVDPELHAARSSPQPCPSISSTDRRPMRLVDRSFITPPHVQAGRRVASGARPGRLAVDGDTGDQREHLVDHAASDDLVERC